DERAVRRRRAVDRVLVPRLPERVVAREEREVDAGGTRGLDAGALAARPVFVMADGEKHFRTRRSRQLGREAVRVDAGPVLDEVALLLEEPDHRVLGVEHVIRDAVSAALRTSRERPVVADLVAAIG